jgi:hypothetical protein
MAPTNEKIIISKVTSRKKASAAQETILGNATIKENSLLVTWTVSLHEGYKFSP